MGVTTNAPYNATQGGGNPSLTSRASASYTLTTPLSLPMAVSRCDDDDDDPVVDMLVVLVPPWKNARKNGKPTRAKQKVGLPTYVILIIQCSRQGKVRAQAKQGKPNMSSQTWRPLTNGFANVLDVSVNEREVRHKASHSRRQDKRGTIDKCP